MDIRATTIPDVLLITPKKFGDERGFFSETYSSVAFCGAGIDKVFVQDNHSLSADVHTLRGLHFQKPPFAQAKLVRCIRGRILDVAVDIRKGSPTYGQHVAATLDPENWTQILVPRGFAHGFVTLAPDTEVIYKVDNPYSAEHDAGLAWDDPDLGIDWQLAGHPPKLSAKDQKHPRLADFDSPFTYDA